MIESPPSRAGRRDARAVAGPTSMSLLTAVFSVLVVLQTVSHTDQAAMQTVDVVRVVRVDVPPVVRSYDAKPDAGELEPPPLLLGCTYALEGGENDDENGGTVTTTTTATTTTAAAATETSASAPTANETGGRGERSTAGAADPASDAAMEEVQHQRGLVVKWYFRRDPTPADDPMAIIDDSVQVYQWLAGGGPEAGGGLGPLSGRVVDVTAETPRANRSLLHRVIRVERPTAELTGEYRCQVEDWHAERRSAWHPMVVYTPERIFKISVDDNDDDDEHDITEGSGGEANSTTQMPSTTSSNSAPLSSGSKQWPTEINITCYAAGVHPEPSMSIWVNGVVQDSVTMVVTDDDGDDDQTNDEDDATSTTAATTTTTTTTTSTTTRPKVRGRFRGGNRGDATVVYKNYAVRAAKVVSLKEVEERRTGAYKQPRRRNAVEVECRLRVPGDGAGDGHWKADRYYSARRSVAYKYRGDSSDAYAAVSSASSMDDGDRDDGDGGGGGDDAAARESANGAASTWVRPAAGSVLLLAAVLLRSAAAVGGQ